MSFATLPCSRMSIHFANRPPFPPLQQHSPVHSPDDPKIALLGECRKIQAEPFREHNNEHNPPITSRLSQREIGVPAVARGRNGPPSPRGLGYGGQPPLSAVLRAKAGAGEGNRTHLAGPEFFGLNLGSRCMTTGPRPPDKRVVQLKAAAITRTGGSFGFGGTVLGT